MFEAVDRVMKNKRGGAVPRRTQIGGQDHMLSYITPTEAEILMQLGGSGEPGPAGIPAFPPAGQSGPGANVGPDDSGGGADDRDGGRPTGISPGQSQAQFGTTDFAGMTPGKADMAARDRAGMTSDYGGYEDDDFGFAQPATSGGGVVGAQQSYNMANAITLDNPYGNKGFFTRVFGIPANKISYSNIMSANTRASIANNQFSKFANPTNQPGKIGYNPDFPTAEPGFLRSGVQKKGFNTALGPVQEFSRKRSPTDMLAIAGIGALNPAFGILAEALTDTTYGVGGIAPPDAAPPGEPQTFTGQAFAAVTEGIKEAYDAARETLGALADRLTPEQAKVVAEATPEQKADIQQELGLSGFENRFDTLAEQMAFSPATTTTTSQVSTTGFSGLTSDQKAGVISAEQQARANAAAAGKDISTAGNIARARAIADALRENQQDSVSTTSTPATTYGMGFTSQPSLEEMALSSFQAPLQDTVAFRPDTEAQQTAKQLGLASLGTPDELSGVPMSGTVPSRTLGSLVDSLPDAPSLSMQSIPGFTQDALTADQNPFIFGGGDGPDRPTQEETEGDEDPYSYDPKITGGFYDYGQPPTFDDRILIPTEEVLKDRFNIVIPPVFSIDPL